MLIKAATVAKKSKTLINDIENGVRSLETMKHQCVLFKKCDKRLTICSEKHPLEIEIDGRRVLCWLYSERNRF
ncbi:MAG: hypothetical protein B6U94_04670 [Thermofilum sp. ex4484_79]|nr:MAG: hypothetical protein B6U94_04670 [Thermofilum sp. ex4484_79]